MIDDYYEPFDFDYQHLHTAPIGEHQPIARPRSLITGKRIQKLNGGQIGKRFLGQSLLSVAVIRILMTYKLTSMGNMKTPL